MTTPHNNQQSTKQSSMKGTMTSTNHGNNSTKTIKSEKVTKGKISKKQSKARGKKVVATTVYRPIAPRPPLGPEFLIQLAMNPVTGNITTGTTSTSTAFDSDMTGCSETATSGSPFRTETHGDLFLSDSDGESEITYEWNPIDADQTPAWDTEEMIAYDSLTWESGHSAAYETHADCAVLWDVDEVDYEIEYSLDNQDMYSDHKNDDNSQVSDTTDTSSSVIHETSDDKDSISQRIMSGLGDVAMDVWKYSWGNTDAQLCRRPVDPCLDNYSDPRLGPRFVREKQDTAAEAAAAIQYALSVAIEEATILVPNIDDDDFLDWPDCAPVPPPPPPTPTRKHAAAQLCRRPADSLNEDHDRDWGFFLSQLKHQQDEQAFLECSPTPPPTPVACGRGTLRQCWASQSDLGNQVAHSWQNCVSV